MQKLQDKYNTTLAKLKNCSEQKEYETVMNDQDSPIVVIENKLCDMRYELKRDYDRITPRIDTEVTDMKITPAQRVAMEQAAKLKAKQEAEAAEQAKILTPEQIEQQNEAAKLEAQQAAKAKADADSLKKAEQERKNTAERRQNDILNRTCPQ